MGQYFFLAPVPAGTRCNSSDYGAGQIDPISHAATPSSYLNRSMRSFPTSSRLYAYTQNKVEGMGRLRHVA